MRRRVWREQGVVSIAIEDITDDWVRQVVINEAVELAKRYGPTDSFKFVNAVLDKSSRELRGAAAKPGGEH